MRHAGLQMPFPDRCILTPPAIGRQGLVGATFSPNGRAQLRCRQCGKVAAVFADRLAFTAWEELVRVRRLDDARGRKRLIADAKIRCRRVAAGGCGSDRAVVAEIGADTRRRF